MSGFVEPAFKIARPNVSDFQIWRIENFKVTVVPKEHHGQFFEGDAYIVYSCSPARSMSAIRSRPVDSHGSLEAHIHFWLGAKSSQDERGTAAIKTVELDDYLGGSPIQHREAQGYESPQFKSYFKNGLRILTGGVASGFRHVIDTRKVRLFKVKGKRCPTLTEQPKVSWEHFNRGDVFILQTKKYIFVWIGKESNHMERIQGAKVAVQLRDENSEGEIVFVDDEKEEELPQEEQDEFDEQLPIANKTVNPAENDVSDVKMEVATRGNLLLYRVSDEDGTCRMMQVKEGPIDQTDLDNKDSFIVDNRASGVWVWVGRKATPQEKKQAMINAQGFVKLKDYPETTAVTRVIDGAEPTEFKLLFTSWKDPNHTVNPMKRQSSGNKIATTISTKFDAKTLHESPGLAADTQLVDDGSGKTVVWRLHDKDLETVPDDQFGQFFSGDCYLVHYIYEIHNKAKHLLYYWLGAHSSQDERGTIAWHTVQKDNEFNGAAVQIRVVQYKEPPHFLTIFKGSMIMFNGGYSSSFEGKDGKDIGVPQTFLIQVRGGENHNSKAVQVEFRGGSLNTNDVFVLRTPKVCFIWCGKGSTGDERERAKVIAEQWATNKEYEVISEGQEKPEFWEILGGQEEYANDVRLADPLISKPARLFHCSDASGAFRAEEILDFCQNDLVSDDVMVLDAYRAIFVWVGEGSNKAEKSESIRLVQEYLQSDPSSRDPDTPIIIIQQGHEPPTFTGFFGIWDTELWKDTFDSVRNNIEGERTIIILNAEDSVPDDKTQKYSLDFLIKVNAENAPEHLDLLHKEKHLNEEEFIKAFGMKRKDFESLPAWRQTNLKKTARLF